MEKLVRWDRKVTPAALVAAVVTEVIIARVVHAQLSEPLQIGAARPLPLLGLGWVELLLLGLPALVAAGALVARHNWQVVILSLALVGLIAGILWGLPVWLDPHSPGLQLVVPTALLGVALTLACQRKDPSHGSTSGGSRPLPDGAG